MEELSPEKAAEILAAHGTLVTVEQAKIILEFMYKLANLALTQYVTNESSRFIHPCEH